AITYRDGRVYADARGPKDLYSEDVESMGLFGAVISKMEVRKMQRRMRNSHRARANQGTPPGGTRPFGWLPDRLTLDPYEAPLLRRAAEEFIAGRSLNSIVNEWQRIGAVTTLGNRWTATSLKATLSIRGCAAGGPSTGSWCAVRMAIPSEAGGRRSFLPRSGLRSRPSSTCARDASSIRTARWATCFRPSTMRRITC